MSDDDKVWFNPLCPSGDLDAPIPAFGERTAAMKGVDKMFLDRAREALGEVGCGAIDFLMKNRGISTIELTRILGQKTNCKVNAIGFIMAVYKEAGEKGVVRETAKDLLVREILTKFPDGWTSTGNVAASVKIGGWNFDAGRYGHDPTIVSYTRAILRELAIHHPPAEGWKPQAQNDPLIEDLFDHFWPVEPRS